MQVEELVQVFVAQHDEHSARQRAAEQRWRDQGYVVVDDDGPNDDLSAVWDAATHVTLGIGRISSGELAELWKNNSWVHVDVVHQEVEFSPLPNLPVPTKLLEQVRQWVDDNIDEARRFAGSTHS
ncbi:unannotated protein [freshwater metagenome]|uniref:Unannotated protein n=1 Tax=freshwater metagenome TaxID=449393 RepID=A0A6J7GZ21_9ZZZZ|nr:hypothetical protein [Actinomycetota bacterium]